MDERIRFIEHKGKQILLLDFSLATAQQMIPLLTEVRTAVADTPRIRCRAVPAL
jgi:hypothetical protein